MHSVKTPLGPDGLPDRELISLCEAVVWVSTGKARSAEVLRRLMNRHHGSREPASLWRMLEEDAGKIVGALSRGDLVALGQLDGGPHEAMPLNYFTNDVFAEFPSDVIGPDPLAFEQGTYPEGLPIYRNVRFRRNDLRRALRHEVRSTRHAALADDTPDDRSGHGAAPPAFEASHWNLLQTLAWIYLADRDLVQQAAEPGTGVIRSKLVELPDGSTTWSDMPDYPATVMALVRDDETQGSRYPSLSEATDALISDLAANRITAIGLRNNQGDPSPIPSDFWVDARFTYEPETAGPRNPFRPSATRWFGLRFPRGQILSLWPDPNLMQTPERSPSPSRLSFLVLARRWLADTPGTGLTPEELAVELVREAEEAAFTSRPIDGEPTPPTYNARFKFVIHTFDQQGTDQGPQWLRNFVAAAGPGHEYDRRLTTARDISVELPAVASWLPTDAGAEWARIRGLAAPTFFGPIQSAAKTATSATNATIASETRCYDWLVERMRRGDPEKTKAKYRDEAVRAFQVSKRGFDRAWIAAVKTTGNIAWRKRGPKLMQ